MSNVARMTQMIVAGRMPEWHQGDYLRKARESAGMSQAELAEVTGMSRRTVVRYESGEGVLRRPQMIAWAMATGVSLEWLQTGKGPHLDGPGGGQRLPRLDSNQRPSDYMSAQVIEGPWGAVGEQRAA